MRTFYGKLKDTFDIAFHFNFEGCSGFGDMMSRLDGKRILFATLEPDNSFFMLAQDKDEVGLNGIYAVLPLVDNPEPADFQLIPAHIGGTLLLLASGVAPEGLSEFFLEWYPKALQGQLETVA